MLVPRCTLACIRAFPAKTIGLSGETSIVLGSASPAISGFRLAPEFTSVAHVHRVPPHPASSLQLQASRGKVLRSDGAFRLDDNGLFRAVCPRDEGLLDKLGRKAALQHLAGIAELIEFE